MRRHIQLYWANPYIQGGFFLTFSSFIGSMLNYFFNFLAARVLGPSGYGELIAFYSYIALFSVPMVVLSNIIIQRVSSHTINPYVYAKSFTIQFRKILFYFLPIAILSLLLSSIIHRITNLSLVVSCLVVPSILVGIIQSFYSSLLQGLKLFFLFSLLSIIAVLFKLFSIFIPVFKYGGLSEVLIFQFTTAIFVVCLSISILSRLFRKYKASPPSPALVTLRRLMISRQFFIMLFSVLSFTILSNLDIMYVKKFFLSDISGIYSSWSLFAKIILYLVGPLIQVSFVFFAGNSEKRLQDRMLLMSLGLLVLIGILGYIGYTTFGSILIVDLFGIKFLKIVPYLGLASIFGTFYTAVSFLNTFFLAKKSRAALILIILLPIYFVTLLLIPKNLFYLMWTNIIFTAFVAFSYLGAFFLSMRNSLIR